MTQQEACETLAFAGMLPSDVPCPACGAAVGHRCAVPMSVPVHMARLDDAALAAAGVLARRADRAR